MARARAEIRRGGCGQASTGERAVTCRVHSRRWRRQGVSVGPPRVRPRVRPLLRPRPAGCVRASAHEPSRYARPRAAAPDRPRPGRARASGMLEDNLARHHELLAEARAGRRGPRRVPGARADRVPAPGPRRRGRDAPRRPPAGGARRRHGGPVGRRVVRGGVGRPPAVHRGRAARGRPRSATSTARCTCRPTACSTSAGSSPPGDMLRAVPSRLGVGRGHSRSARTSGTCRRPSCLALDGAQILVNVSSSPGRDLARTQRGGPGDGGARGGRSCGRTPS